MLNIKFRGKLKHGDKWIYGYFFKYSDDSCWIQERMPNGSLHAQEVIPETVGQWTGHQDYHGVDIYKDDVVEWDSEDGYVFTGLVIWEEEHEDTSEICGFHYKIIASREAPEDSDDCVYKVIDNIHDNPSLLK